MDDLRKDAALGAVVREFFDGMNPGAIEMWARMTKIILQPVNNKQVDTLLQLVATQLRKESES